MAFHLGAAIDAASGERRPTPLLYDPSDLTTHGVIVGMTGSGKTGLGVIFLEEALRNGIPALILDPKGDMTNLALSFPELAAADFEPWLDPAAVENGEAPAAAAARVADLWRSGLADWGLGGAEIQALRDRAGFTVYTPGSTSGVPLNVVGSLSPPPLSWDDQAETIRDEILGFVSGILGLIGIDADPISSREHILLCNLVEHAWRAGTTLDMATLLGWVQRPPLRKLGVLDVDGFYPEAARRQLAMQLNGLLASPAFASWMEGPAIDIEALLWRDGRPQAAIIYLAHLGEPERQFVVTLVLSKLITWMRSQPGSSQLRVLTYMDEVFGFAPPTAQPPAKRPILTILKQGRAFGVGMLIATQNPVDLDYKAMSNAGTWAIGRLQTERDKARILEALSAASGDVDVAGLDTVITGLEKRRFVLHNTHQPPPIVFTTRWAMSYLRGPLTREEISRLGQSVPEPAVAPPTSPVAADAVPIMPQVAAGTIVGHLDPAAPWAAAVRGNPAGGRYEAALTFRVGARYDDTRAGVDHLEEWEAVLYPLTSPVVAADLLEVDHDPRDRLTEPPRVAPYTLPAAPIDRASYIKETTSVVRDHVARTGTLTVLRNQALRQWSRPGETAEDFIGRCRQIAEASADVAAGHLRDRYQDRIAALRRRLGEAVARAETAAARLDAEQRDQLFDQAGAVFDLLSGRGGTRRLTSAGRGRRAAESGLRTAEDRVEVVSADIRSLEGELAAELDELSQEWDAKAEMIDEVEITLEKTDVDISEVALVWVLTGDA